jgi:hypothetical protein
MESLRILDKAGYCPCGLLHLHCFFGDEWLGEILREEWKGLGS